MMAAVTLPSGLDYHSAPCLAQRRLRKRSTTCSIQRHGVNNTGAKNAAVNIRPSQRRAVLVRISGPESGEGEADRSSPEGLVKKKKGIKREEEPEQFWKTQAEIDGKNPMQTLLPYFAILGLLIPFIILGIAYSAGYIKTPN